MCGQSRQSGQGGQSGHGGGRVASGASRGRAAGAADLTLWLRFHRAINVPVRPKRPLPDPPWPALRPLPRDQRPPASAAAMARQERPSTLDRVAVFTDRPPGESNVA